MKRFSLLVLPLLALVFLGAGCFTTTVDVAVENTNGAVEGAETVAVTVPLTITKAADTTTTYDITVDAETSALALLEQAAADKQFVVDTKTYDFGVMVEGIDGVKADNTHFWSFYINGTPASVGAGEYKPQSGDRIEFRFEAM